MVMNNSTLSPLLRLSAALLLVRQILYIVVTLLDTGGDANNHTAILAAYAGSGPELRERRFLAVWDPAALDAALVSASGRAGSS
jgi:hypothetical protein